MCGGGGGGGHPSIFGWYMYREKEFKLEDTEHSKISVVTCNV